MGKKNLLLLGGSGLIGSALRKLLNQSTEWNVIAPTRQDLDLREAQAVAKFFDTLRSEVVINAAGKSGGVLANKNYPADFILENNQIQMNILHSALRSKVAKLIQFIPACIYPTTATLPYREASILTGPLEESSQYFAIAKINALMMAQAFNRQHGTQFISLIPSNVYGPMTKTASENSHVVPSLLHKMKSAKATNTPHVEVWGNGSNLRDYLHTLDLARATVAVLQNEKSPEVLNVGSGTNTSVQELSECIREVTGYAGEIRFSANDLSGAQNKFLDLSGIRDLGWKAQIDLKSGLKDLANS